MKFSIKYRVIASAIVGIAAITELTLRIGFGLGNPILSQTDPDTGYVVRPNQKVFRLGKVLEYNQYSQRSEQITPDKPLGVLRILMVGDSILNGGNPTDRSQTITELFKSKLSASGHSAQVLNASAGGWAIGNELGYLRKFGTFQSDAVILEIGTNDLSQATATSDIVGHHPAFPDRPPLTAIQDAWSRYFWPSLLGILNFYSPSTDFAPNYVSVEPARQFEKNLQEVEAIAKLVRTQKHPFFVLFVPDLSNLVPINNPPKYKLALIQKLKSLEVPVIDVQLAWSILPQATVKTYFRSDELHLSVSGNQSVANLLDRQLCGTDSLKVCYNYTH